jgi:predicted CXXCH cytochrome family protein
VFLAALLLIFAVGIIGGAVLMRRGFRATTSPSSLEVALARRVRNLAIPAHERSRKSPFQATTEATQQGREYYLNRCSACHGIDGSAKTQIGLNLYPRVPDLRASGTQNLTDGELHYIIENEYNSRGCRRGAMPTLESSGKSWKLIFFIRTLVAAFGSSAISRKSATTIFLCRYSGMGQTPFYYFPDYTAHKNRMQGNDFVQNVMYRHGMTCSTCHDVHGAENYAQLRKPAAEICLDCHGLRRCVARTRRQSKSIRITKLAVPQTSA